MAKQRRPAAAQKAQDTSTTQQAVEDPNSEDDEPLSDEESSEVETSSEAATGSADESDPEGSVASLGEAESNEDGDSDEDGLDQALLDVVSLADPTVEDGQRIVEQAERRPRNSSEATDSLPPQTQANDPASDSSEDERKPRNTVGDVPLHWYKNEDHLGYTRRGQKLQKRAQKDKLEALLAKNDSGHAWRTIYDEYNDEELTLSKEEIELLQRIRQGRFPHVEVNPYEPEADWFTRDQEIHPLISAPEPKRRFMPSKWEEKKIVKLVRALRKGWIKREKEEPKEPDIYLLWEDSTNVAGWTASEKASTYTIQARQHPGLQYLPPTKTKLPGHAESYNPPPEYMPSQEEKNAYELLDDEDKPSFVPQLFTSLRKVPAYEGYIKERFERCLDLYLCPRKARKRPYVKDPQTLVPKLPKPQDLQPFPTTLLLQFLGHTAAVLSISLDPSGQWLASGSSDGTIRLWEASTGRSLKTWDLASPVKCVAWCPNTALCLLSAATMERVVLLNPGLGTEEVEAATLQALKLPEDVSENAVCTWNTAKDIEGALELKHRFAVSYVHWHSRGDYFASVAPKGESQAVLVHQLSKKGSQNPFKRSRGRVVQVQFHPAKPFLFVATLDYVLVYNLAEQKLVKKLLTGSSNIASMAIHPSGDHVIVGKQDNRLLWFDLDLSTKPYKSMKYHEKALEGVAFHRRYPLFASASADGTVHVFHGMVYQDYLTNPLIVPVKILRGHKVVDHQGVLDCVFHPQQPWIFSAGADSTISLYTN